MRKILQNRNKGLPLQPQMRNRVSYLRGDRVLKIFLKKSFQNIWYIQKYELSLHRFSALKKRVVNDESSDAN